MTELVRGDIESIVGVPRHSHLHIGRAVSGEGQFYIMHPSSCIRQCPDLRDCPWTLALGMGIEKTDQWEEDVPLRLDLSINEDFSVLKLYPSPLLTEDGDQ